MGTLQRRIGIRAVRHAVVETTEHKEDVEENNRRRSVYWLGIEQQLEDEHRIVPELSGGIYFVRDETTGNLDEVNGDQLIARLDKWVAEKSWYLREVRDAKCKSGKRWKRTQTKGVQGHVVTFSPWWSNLLYEEARSGNAAKVKELGRRAALELKSACERQSKRQVLSVQIHYDTVNMHAHVFTTRIGDDHRFIPGTTKKLGLIGPWACGVLRQSAAGFIPEDSTNCNIARRYFARNEKRMGGPPLDYEMCRVVDTLCYEVFGFSPRLNYWQRIYMQGLPMLSLNRLVALHNAVGREVQRWQQHAARSRDYAPREFEIRGSVNGGQELALN